MVVTTCVFPMGSRAIGQALRAMRSQSHFTLFAFASAQVRSFSQMARLGAGSSCIRETPKRSARDALSDEAAEGVGLTMEAGVDHRIEETVDVGRHHRSGA